MIPKIAEMRAKIAILATSGYRLSFEPFLPGVVVLGLCAVVVMCRYTRAFELLIPDLEGQRLKEGAPKDQPQPQPPALINWLKRNLEVRNKNRTLMPNGIGTKQGSLCWVRLSLRLLWRNRLT